MARGMVWVGSFTSSPAVDTASRPMYEKKMPPVAARMPVAPMGAKSARLLVFQPVMPTATNMTSTAILMITITALTVADSLAPRISSIMHSPTSTMAGMLMMPTGGAAASTCGICQPVRLSSSWLRYSDQPTETAAPDTPYSRMRQAAITMATPSPSVA